MVGNRTSVGLDVHARSVAACGLDGQTGQLFERRLTPDRAEIAAWVAGLPGPVAVTYEAGPTVCELDGPIPILNRSKALSATADLDVLDGGARPGPPAR